MTGRRRRSLPARIRANLSAFRRDRSRAPSRASRRVLRWLGVAGLVALAVVAAAALVDASSVGWMAGLSPPQARVFAWVTEFGRSPWYLIPAGIVAVLALLADWASVGRRVAAGWAELGALAAYLFLAVGLSVILVNILKQVIGRVRPLGFEDDGAFSFDAFAFDHASASFPSGHATTAGAAMMAGALIAPRAAPVFAAIAVVLGVSRVFVGAHYPSDVIAGLALGAVSAIVVAGIFAARRIGFTAGRAGLRARTRVLRRVGPGRLLSGLVRALAGSTPSPSSAPIRDPR